MNDGKKRAIIVVADILLLAAIVAAVYFMLFGNGTSDFNNLLTAIIVICIPSIFLMTFTTFAGNKYDIKEPDEDEEEGEEKPSEDL